MSESGWFFVLEGSDGSGKTTQLNILKERLMAAGYEVEVFDFPRYEKPSSYFVKQYLDGNYGPAGDVSPYTASLFYALDRFESAPLIRQSLSDGKIVLANRYVGSNMAHQGSKFSAEGEKRGFFLWADSLEFQLMGIPRPTLNLFLRLPAKISINLMRQRSEATGRKLDEHEASKTHLAQAVTTYDLLCELFPKDFKSIDCAPYGNLLPIPDVSDLVWSIVKPMLPSPPHAGKPRVIKLGQATSAYTQTEANNLEKQEPEIQPKNGGELVIQFKNISLLMLRDFQAIGGLGVKFELNWDKVDEAFYTPFSSSSGTTPKYVKFMKELARNYRQIESEVLARAGRGTNARQLADTLDSLVPMAAVCKGSIKIRPGATDDLLKNLRLSQLPEAAQIIKTWEPLFNQTGPSADQSSTKTELTLKEPAEKQAARNSAGSEEAFSVIGVWPRNELDLLVESLYPYSGRSYEEIEDELSGWKYDQKLDAFKSVADAGQNLAQAVYRFDVIGDYLDWRALSQLKIGTHLVPQPISPRFGYEVPVLVEKSGVEDQYLELFDKSLEFYSQLQSEGQTEIAGYVCLSGHKSRWQFQTTAYLVRQALGRADLNFKQKAILRHVLTNISESHPIIGGCLAQFFKNSQQRAQANSKVVRAPRQSSEQKQRQGKQPKSRKSRR